MNHHSCYYWILLKESADILNTKSVAQVCTCCIHGACKVATVYKDNHYTKDLNNVCMNLQNVQDKYRYYTAICMLTMIVL